jgi:hypothetical protein
VRPVRLAPISKPIAKLDHAPVLAMTRGQEISVLGTGYQQEMRVSLHVAELPAASAVAAAGMGATALRAVWHRG